MITVKRVETLAELQWLMPLFMEGFRAMNKRKKAFDCDEQGFIKTLVGVLGTGPDNGILVSYSDELPVGYGVAFEDTPTYCEEKHLLLWALYIKVEYSKLVTPALFGETERLAKELGYKHLRAYNGRLNGSSINFFERVLGMRRHRIEFTKPIQ
jgi:hypothetical protein